MLVSFVLAACAGTAAISPETPGEQKAAVVGQRAEERWKALIAEDYSGAYAYISPAARQLVSLEQFKASVRGELRYREIKVDNVSCEADACKVRILLTYDHRQMKGIVTPIEESWVLDKGQFWYLYRG